jgi:AcrR family transcriptional regulator
LGAGGATTARAAARAARREQLLDAADRAIRRDGPEVSMEALASEAGITKPVLYRHFEDRDGLLDAVATRHARRLTDELRAALAEQHHPRERIRTVVATYLAFLERDPELHRFVTRVAPAQRPGSPTPIDDALTVLCDEIVDAVARELTGARLDPSPAVTWGVGMVGMVQLTGERWLEARDVPRETLVHRLTDLLWHGFRGIVLRGTA